MESDREFYDSTIKTVDSESDSGWCVTMANGWSLFVCNDNMRIPPVPGETIRLFGRGIGAVVRGIVVGGRVYRYQSQEQSDTEQAELRAKYKREREEAEAKFAAELPSLPPLPAFDKLDVAGWEKCVANNSDPYGYACVKYAAAWANLMESRMRPHHENGDAMARVVEVAEKASRDADTEGITGFMYGVAVSMLAGCWRYGEQLRQWHNNKTAIGIEGVRANISGGVLNPALLSIG